MARPGGSELREGFEETGQGVTDNEGFLGICGIGGPEVEQAVRGGDGVERGEGEEGEGEREPIVGIGVEGLESRIRGDVAVGGFEREEREGLGGAEEVEEGRGGEGVVEGFAGAFCGGDLAEMEVAEYVVECVIWEVV